MAHVISNTALYRENTYADQKLVGWVVQFFSIEDGKTPYSSSMILLRERLTSRLKRLGISSPSSVCSVVSS